MADPRQRVPLQSSFSFSTPSPGDLSSRSLKRRMTTYALDPAYFTPSANTFRPRPYQPPQSQQSQEEQRAQRSQEQEHPSSSVASSARGSISRNHSLTISNLNNDPSPSDPDTIFIHPPFVQFPDAEKHKDGLTYNLLATNPEWFLDPADFINVLGTNPEGIRYPSQLEPPRGWCPARKKDMKDGWPEGEEPRLRCTFCRRTYAGVNAKSMWRRHVYEKHKIAMSNRRDNQDRKGGRGSNKENKDKENVRSYNRGVRRTSGDAESMSSSLNRASSDTSECKHPSSSKAEWSHRDDDSNEEDDPAMPQLVPDERFGPEGEPDLFQAIKSSSTPPLTPGFSPITSAQSRRLKDFLLDSPYDPLVTPSFRHSPARLPSDQPWRFPSPSHPLHSKAPELSLSMLMRGEASPVVSGLDVSPIVIVPASERGKRSIFSSPLAPPTKDRESTLFPGPSPRRLFYEGPVPVSSTDGPTFKEYRNPESPFGRPSTSTRPRKRNLGSITGAMQSWQTDLPLVAAGNEAPGLLGPIQLQGEDPFTEGLYNSWVDLSGATDDSARDLAPPVSLLEESPVVRSHQPSSSGTSARAHPGLSGLGAGLMDAFLSGKGRTQRGAESSSDDDDLLTDRFGGSPVHVGKKTRRGFMVGWPRDDGGDTEMSDTQPKKRRKTINGRN